MKYVLEVLLIICALIFFVTQGRGSGYSYYTDVYLKKKKAMMKRLNISEEEYKQICRSAIKNETETTLPDGRKFNITRL